MADLAQFPYVFANGPGNTPDADKMMSDLQHLRTYVNSALDADNIAAGTLDVARLPTGIPATNIGSSSDRGKSIIATSETTASTSYTTLTTPDVVPSIVLPTNGLIYVAYNALVWGGSVGTGNAAIFLGSNQVKVWPKAADGGAPIATHASMAGGTNFEPLMSCPEGLAAQSSGPTSAVTSAITTGQALAAATNTGGLTVSPDSGTSGSWTTKPGVCVIFAAAGTYDVSVKYKCTTGGGLLTAKERKLWVEAKGY